jgi:quinohemoprotein ethanol dehydrogenase
MRFSRKLAGAAAMLVVSAIALTAVAQTAPAQKAAGKTVAAVKSGGRALGAAAVNMSRHLNANSEPGTWMSAGRTFDQQRYSPLTQINHNNISRLSLAWYGDMDTVNAQEATPVIVDGVLYVTTNWSMVKAYNAKTGEKLWEYDPKVDRADSGGVACCGTVNRGVAAWNGKVYVAALDGRLIALNGRTGAVVWSVQTTDPDKPYTITGVPVIVRGKVVIGNAGAEYTCRGYVSAYDAETGRQIWRFYTVPDNPNDPNNKDPEILKRYAATWTGEWWKMGGGATAWDAILYDPKSAARVWATTSSSPRSSRSRPTLANTHGTIRACPAMSGTTTSPIR